VIPDLVLGTMYFGTRTDRATSFALLDRFVEAGGRTIDTANCYAFWASDTGAGGQSESVLGEWLRHDPGMRDRVEISTKVGVEPATPGDFAGPVEGLSPDVVRRESARSLERLGVDTVDTYWAHAPDPTTPVEQTAEVMDELVRNGAVRRIGFSNFPTWQVERARGHASVRALEPVTALQLSTSYVEPRPGAAVEGKDHRFGWVTDETRDYATLHGLEVWAYSPLIQGAFDRPDRPFPQAYDHPGTTARLAVLTDVAARLGVRRGQLVLAWLLHSRPQLRPIAGVSSLEQLEETLAAADLALDADLMAELDAPR
jgi:aryl-alcohol dehydrogenase-like predicted oxidoreductase